MRHPARFIRLLLVALGFALLLGACSTREQIRKELMQDPQLLMDVLHEKRFELLDMLNATVLERQQMARAEQDQKDLEANLAPVIQGDRPVEGAPEAPVLIVEYSDFLCPYCVRGHETMNQLLADHPDKVRVLYKHNPIKQGAFGLASIYEAIVGIDHKKALEFKDKVFKSQRELHEEIAGGMQGAGEVIPSILESLGLDTDKVLELARAPEIAQRIQEDAAELRSFGLEGTPMYVVGSVPVRGAQPKAEFERIITLLLESQTGSCKDCVN